MNFFRRNNVTLAADLSTCPPPSYSDLYQDTMVRAAALRLDAIRPNWDDRVNVETLNLTSVYDCVLGQIFEDVARTEVIPCEIDGFEGCGCGGSRARSGYEYAMRVYPGKLWDGSISGVFSDDIGFRQAWIDEIQRRRAAKAVELSPAKADHALTA